MLSSTTTTNPAHTLAARSLASHDFTVSTKSIAQRRRRRRKEMALHSSRF